MTLLQETLAVVFLAAGGAFMLVGSIGIVRLPDFYTRTHAASKIDTMGIMLLLAGLAFHEGMTLSTGKLVLLIVFVAVANPVGSHALARSALRFGLKPWYAGEPKGAKYQ
ncbi:MAG: monovalent cation/H(+) antiporter subunit G [Thermodesulfobacteriota bacterium]|jgi:multicomponent Na+:H+ antiporter subunit G